MSDGNNGSTEEGKVVAQEGQDVNPQETQDGGASDKGARFEQIVTELQGKLKEFGKENAKLNDRAKQFESQNKALQDEMRKLSEKANSETGHKQQDTEKLIQKAYNDGVEAIRSKLEEEMSARQAAETGWQQYAVKNRLSGELYNANIIDPDVATAYLTGESRPYDIRYNPSTDEVDVLHRKGDNVGQPVFNKQTGTYKNITDLVSEFASKRPHLVAKSTHTGAGSSQTSINNNGLEPPTDPVAYSVWRNSPQGKATFGER